MKKLNPKVSVIIATLNAEAGLEKTILSFVHQTYLHKELIIIDGGSTDKTLNIIKEHQREITFWSSKKDLGISDAFNKGIKKASGDYLYFMSTGDTFTSVDILSKMMDKVNSHQDWLISGQIRRVSQAGKELYVTNNHFNKRQLLYKMAIPHQGLFTHKLFFKKYGLFDLNYKYTMDYDLLLRAYTNFPKLIQKDIIVANWIEGGVGWHRTQKVIEEYHRVRMQNKIAPLWILNIIHMLTKLRYYNYE